MTISRRSFLKAVGGALAVAAISPKGILAPHNKTVELAYSSPMIIDNIGISEELLLDSLSGGFLVPLEYHAGLMTVQEDQAIVRPRVQLVPL